MKRVQLEYEGLVHEVERWPPEFRCLLKIVNCFFPHVQVEHIMVLGDAEKEVKTTQDLGEVYRLSESTGLVRLKIMGKELSSQNLCNCLPPPGFNTPAPEVQPVCVLKPARTQFKPKEEYYMQCFKCSGTGKRSVCNSDCHTCKGQGVIDLNIMPKYSAYLTFIRQEIKWYSLAALSDQAQTAENSEVHSTATCAACLCNPIKGVRYKCSICADFNFCSKCELHNSHPHPFIKLRKAQQNEESQRYPKTFGKGKNRQCDPDSRLCCRFVKDVIGRQGEVHGPNETFRKSWKVRNIGKTAWPEGCTMIFVNGDFEGPPVKLPMINPEEECEVCVCCKAPTEEGAYYSNWRACDPDGMRFGHRLNIEIKVTKEGGPKNVTDVEKLQRCLEARPEKTLEALRRAEGDVATALSLLPEL